MQFFQKKKANPEEKDVIQCSIDDQAKMLSNFVKVLLADEIEDLTLPVFFQSITLYPSIVVLRNMFPYF